MTYFPDLTAYTFGSACDGGEPDLNVGWLSHEHPFPRQVPDSDFVDALFRCCLRPVRLYRGIHICDLGCDVPSGYEALTRDYDGRTIRMGNGEVRVTGPDSQIYSAPTLVAHYVADHSYVPPRPFVEGVLQRSRSIAVLCGESLFRVRALSTKERFNLCVEALRLFQAQNPVPQVDRALALLIAAAPALDPDAQPEYLAELRDLEAFRFPTRPDPASPVESVSAAVSSVVQFFTWTRRGEEAALGATLQLTAAVLEHLHEAGIRDWRSDMMPNWRDRTC